MVEQPVADLLLTISETDFVDELVEHFRLNVPTLLEHDATAESDETKLRIPRGDIYLGNFGGPTDIAVTKTTIIVPFEGERDLFFVRPHTFTLNPPIALVSGNSLSFSFTRRDNDGAALKREYEKTINYVRTALDNLRPSASTFNANLPTLVCGEVKRRKKRILDGRGMVAELGIRIKKREDVARAYEVPVERRRIAKIAAIEAGSFQPEPVLGLHEYEDILRLLRSMSLTMELSPKVFETIGEEHLRFHFLVVLNAVFEGQAIGETFNYEGKTDILIRQDGRNVFVAECKFWGGEKAFLETIDQLLSYLSWRDTKAAVLMFNRNVNFSDVTATITEAVPKHKHCKRSLGQTDESSFRYVFGHPDDTNRELTVTVMAFNIPTKR
jgi:hypothetical protein